MNYKDIFEKAYNSQINKSHRIIKILLIEKKTENRRFFYVEDLIKEKLYQEKDDSINLNNSQLKLLQETYSAHEMTYDIGFKSEVLYNELRDKFEDVKDSIDFDYEELICALANLYAIKEMISHFSSYSYNLEDMYDLSKFEGYKNFEKFDLVQLRKQGNQALCDELYEIKNPNLKKDNLSNVILDSDKFQLKNQYEAIFRDIKFYKDLINYFFEEDSISHSEFIKLFVEKQVLDHPVKFHCDTNVAASFIYNLQGKFFKKLSIAYLLNNQTFQSFTETKLTGANLSNTKSKDNSQIFPSLSSKLLQHTL
jgi:hypothetical protein